ncbi:MAG: hypothetical protein IK083_07485 [Abditibacteriota bacterium]|nr:hypothetical protein [Abditibacteriota bacterium]
MAQKPKRKIKLFLVEGKSELEALRNAISEIYDQTDPSVYVRFLVRSENATDESGNHIIAERGGDVTAIGDPTNIEKYIYTMLLKSFFDEEKLLPKDISEIIQITDLDGAYVPENSIKEDKRLSKIRYEENRILCKNKGEIILRNERKKKNLDYLTSKTAIKVRKLSIPYRLYYFSSNLDHFLHHEANLDPLEKVKKAEEYSEQYLNAPEELARKITNDPGAVKGKSYEESWEYIKKGTNSLSRHTNLNILLDELLAQAGS